MRRNCTRCTRWKLDIEFPWRWTKDDSYYVETVCTSCKRKRERERYHMLSREERREYGRRVNQRKRHREHRLREGIKRLAHRAARKEHYKGGEMVSFAPFRAWIIRAVRERGSIVSLADELGYDEARIRRFYQGYYWEHEQPIVIERISIDTVDEVLTRAGAAHMLVLLYPYVYEEVKR